MKFPQIAMVVLLSFAVAFVTVKYVVSNNGAGAVQESAYDHVLRTGILRCGYGDWPPYVFVKDPTTSKISGIFPDVIEAIAAKLNLKVEWSENTGFGGASESLRTHRIDAFCAGLWRNGQRGRSIGFSVPVFYNAVYPYVAAGDHRFDKDLSAVNQPDIHISGLDGEMSDVIAKTYFPKATEVAVPQLGQITDILVNVATHKADIVFNESSFVNDYTKANPNSLRRAQDTPFQIFPASLGFEIHETELREMFNSALTELQNQGIIDQIVAKHTPDTTAFISVAKPYTQQ